MRNIPVVLDIDYRTGGGGILQTYILLMLSDTRTQLNISHLQRQGREIATPLVITRREAHVDLVQTPLTPPVTFLASGIAHEFRLFRTAVAAWKTLMMQIDYLMTSVWNLKPLSECCPECMLVNDGTQTASQ